MVKNWIEKIDNNDTAAGFVGAEDFNSAFNELENVVSPFMALDVAQNNQLVRAIDIISKATHYTDSGTQNAISLTRGATATVIESLFDGMVVSFYPALANNGATTINVNGTGVKPLKFNGADLPINFLSVDYRFTAIYDATNEWFECLEEYATKAYVLANSGYSLIAEHVVSGSAVTSIDIAGLDINAHNGYRIEIEIAGGVSTALSMYINGDTTPTNYYQETLQATGATVGSSNNNNAVITSGAYAFIKGAMALIGGIMRYTGTAIVGTTTGMYVYNKSLGKTASVANITQITLIASVASAIGIGSKVRIYRGDV